MVKDISDNLLNSLTKDKRKIKLIQKIDWDDDGVFESDISDDILSATIDVKSSGKLNEIILDKATITVNNTEGNYSPKNYYSKWNGNVVPFRLSKVLAGNNNEQMELFSGVIQDINPTYKNNKVSLSMGDRLGILKREECPDTFYINEYKENIIKSWLDDLNINYTDNTIDETNETINYSFGGMNYFEAIKKIAKSVWGTFYFSNDLFYFKVNKENPNDTNVVYDLSTYQNDNHDENIFKITEKYNNEELYNEVEISSEPLLLQEEQIIWTGLQNSSENNKQMNYSDIQNKKLYLNDEQKLPILEGSVSITDGLGNVYTKDNGEIKAVDYNKGIIYFKDDFSNNNGFLTVKYKYSPRIIPPNTKQEFIIELEEPTYNIATPDIYIKNIDYETDIRQDTKKESPTKTSNNEYIFKTSLDRLKKVKLNMRIKANMYDERSIHDWEVNHYYYKSANADIHYRKAGSQRWIHAKSFNREIELENETHDTDYFDWSFIKTLSEGEYEIRITCGEKYIVDIDLTSYSRYYDHSNDPKQLNDYFDYNFNVFDNQKQVKFTIKNNSGYNGKLFAKYNNQDNNIYLKGQPFKKTKRINKVAKDEDSIKSFGSKSKLNIDNDLILTEDAVGKLRDYLIHKYSTPRSKLKVETKGVPHLELNDKVYINQEERDVDNVFIIEGIKHKFRDGSWIMELDLVQDTASEWNYDNDSAQLTYKVPENSAEYEYERPNPITNLNIEEDSYVDKLGNWIINLNLYYNYPSDEMATGVEVYMSKNNNDYELLDKISDDKYSVKNLELGEKYQFKINTISDYPAVPYQGEPVFSKEIITQGKDSPPSIPKNFMAIQQKGDIVFKWDEPEGIDVDSYEIREGEEWQFGEIIDTNIKGKSYKTDLNFNGTKHYMIKSIDNGNNYSLDFNSAVTNIKGVEEKYNILIDRDETVQGDGKKENITHLNTDSRDDLILSHCLTFEDLSSETFDSITLFDNFPNTNTYASYITPPIDTFKNERVGVRIKYLINTFDEGATFATLASRTFFEYSNNSFETSIPNYNFNIYISASGDGSSWSNWKKYVAGEYDTRYIKLKFEIELESETAVWYLTKFREVFDLEDKIINDQNISINSSGTTINYSNDYGFDLIEEPKNYYFIVTDGAKFPIYDTVTKDEMTIHLEDVNGNWVSGKGNLYIQGF